MKILYAVQATGNGHISRAMELLPSLNLYGQTDVFLSGANSQLKADLPVRYRSKGLTLFYKDEILDRSGQADKMYYVDVQQFAIGILDDIVNGAE